jgi:hypothetical protein
VCCTRKSQRSKPRPLRWYKDLLDRLSTRDAPALHMLHNLKTMNTALASGCKDRNAAFSAREKRFHELSKGYMFVDRREYLDSSNDYAFRHYLKGGCANTIFRISTREKSGPFGVITIHAIFPPSPHLLGPALMHSAWLPTLSTVKNSSLINDQDR